MSIGSKLPLRYAKQIHMLSRGKTQITGRRRILFFSRGEKQNCRVQKHSLLKSVAIPNCKVIDMKR